MKKYLVFTILLLSSISNCFACGYTPFGEDIRYCLFKPSYFEYRDFYAFYYNANLWGFDYDYKPEVEEIAYEANIVDWYNFTQHKVDIESIVEFNDELKITDIVPNSKNAFLHYLYENKKYDVIRYLAFAKRCEAVNGWTDSNPWERQPINLELKNKQFFATLLK